MITDTVLILGVGNQYRRDDAVGIEVVKRLQQQKLPNAELVVGGVDGLALFDIVTNYQRAIIVDAVEMAAIPGTVKLFTPAEAKINIRGDALSTHGFGIAEVIKLLEELGIKTTIKVIGIQPEDISYGEGLTAKVNNKIPELVEMVKCAMQFQQK